MLCEDSIYTFKKILLHFVERVERLCKLNSRVRGMVTTLGKINVTVFGKTNRLARKTNFFFIALVPFTSSEDAAIQI